MTIYYLMIKTHNITGLKYLCQTRQKDPFIYTGSGIYWKSHLKKYGIDISTTILLETTDRNKLKKFGRAYSNFYNVAKSKEWANKIPETGGGPGWGKGDKNHTKSEKFRKFISESQRGSDNPKFDHQLYHFEHREKGIKEYMTKYDFRKKYNLAHSHVSNLVSGYNYTKSYKGWIVTKW